MFAGHVQEIDSGIQRLAHNCNRLPGVLIDAKIVAAQPDDRRPYSGAPKFSHFHTKTPYSSLVVSYLPRARQFGGRCWSVFRQAAMTKDSVHESSCEPLAARMRRTNCPIA